ncbi:DNA-directed primase/polymerase protein isoform X1 [Hyperolius riggenbachi]|uniref:DNA-directed primase/polymerase protein isoform X1 n=1 Tax=Hyperolius riggenbachi TaxID=752182 RepID=UPI0035A2FAAD
MKKNWLEKLKHVEDLASYYKRHPLSPCYRPKLGKPWQPSSVWRLFHRQATALQFAKTRKEDVHVFALETVLEHVGRRLYLATTYTEFWFYYTKHYQTLAHCYEVIPADTVCKLYFDLEFYKPANPNADGTKMVALLIEFFCRKLEECYDVKCSADCVINLDSSTDEKCSHHLIFVLPNVAFKDNINVGNFVKSALHPLLLTSDGKSTSKDHETSPLHAAHGNSEKSPHDTTAKGCCSSSLNTKIKDCDLSSFLVGDKNGGKQLFIDLGVYTKNRNFRLYKSSKLGKDAVLELAKDNQFSGKPPRHMSTEEHIFLCSLISNVRFTDGLKILTCASPSDANGGPRAGGRETLISGSSFVNGSSPYPEIDEFIRSLVTREGFHGGIRQWNYFSLEELIVYDTVNYRWCENIGRAHKSNNVMLLVDLKREVWYQKCHDPICRAQNFKSNYYALPPEVCLPSMFKEGDEEWALTMDENGNIEKKQMTSHTEVHTVGELVMASSADYNRTCDRGWDDGIDDAGILQASEMIHRYCILEATEDAELVDDDCILEAAEAAELEEDACILEATEDIELVDDDYILEAAEAAELEDDACILEATEDIELADDDCILGAAEDIELANDDCILGADEDVELADEDSILGAAEDVELADDYCILKAVEDVELADGLGRLQGAEVADNDFALEDGEQVDDHILEAADDAELADVADRSVAKWMLEQTDVPDEMLLEAFKDHNTSVKNINCF